MLSSRGHDELDHGVELLVASAEELVEVRTWPRLRG